MLSVIEPPMRPTPRPAPMTARPAPRPLPSIARPSLLLTAAVSCRRPRIGNAIAYRPLLCGVAISALAYATPAPTESRSAFADVCPLRFDENAEQLFSKARHLTTGVLAVLLNARAGSDR